MKTLPSFHETLPTVKLSIAFTQLIQLILSPPTSLFPTLPITGLQPYPARDLLENFRTLYLFTKSDFKTILMPVTIFASIMAPIDRFEHLPQIMFWIWLHLLQFCVSNQIISPEEDVVNKPWRPIPAGRITVGEAQSLRWFIVASCLALSAYRGIFLTSIVLCLSTIAYNDLGFHQHIMMRNVCNAVGYASFELGATQLAGGRTVGSSSVFALIASSLIVFTTIHAADFRDEKGDRLEGKNTIPISFPQASRIAMLVSLVLWSSALSLLWHIDLILSLVLFSMGAVIGLRFIIYRDASDDRKSYLFYNIWLSIAHICLGVGQYRGWATTVFRHPLMKFP